MNTPITLTLYDKNDEPIQTFSRGIVPWGVMKKAMTLMESLQELSEPKAEKTWLDKFAGWFKRAKTDNPTAASMAMLEEFIVEFFGHKFTASDLKNADTAELMAVLQSIIARANSAMPANPTKPQTRR